MNEATDPPETLRIEDVDVAACMLRDRAQVRRDLLRVRERQRLGEPIDQLLVRLQRTYRASAATHAARLASRPNVSFPEALPISAQVDVLQALIAEHQVVVVAGETGSGKTTQLPKICLALGRGIGGMIGHTQPRRLAARTVAARVASELSVELGAQVGYAVRFSDNSGPQTLLRIMTDGVLLNEISRDPLLLSYDTLILDEAHERSLNIDFLLGYLRTLLPRRPDLKLIITSATIDVARFSEHFGAAPVLNIGGRGFPVDIVYVPEAAAIGSADAKPLDEQIRDVVGVIIDEDRQRAQLREAPDVLVFLAGEREILEVSQTLRKADFAEPIDVLPLYARLPNSEQERVFNPGVRRRVVLATNVAETSLTVPRIGYVIDPGTARISRYSYRSKLQRLPIEPIAQASANQRAGRCGRIAPGVCFRLYTQEDFLGRPAFTDAEILRTNLASVVLQMKLLRLGDLGRFPLLDVPEPKAVNDAVNLLSELRALDGDALTPSGRQMARLPIDPRLACMLIAAGREGCVAEVLIIVSALSVQDPRERPIDRQQAADASHIEWRDEDSDFLSYLKLWSWYEQQRVALSRNALRKLCVQRFLAPLRMQEWRDVHRQLHVALVEMKLRIGELAAEPDYARIHRALLTGSLSLVGQRTEKRDYSGARGQRFTLFPGSALVRRPPPWTMAAEIVETGRVFARCVAEIDREWIEQVGEHMLKRQHSEPRWSRKRGEAVVSERATLLGLLVYEQKTVRLAPMDAELAREIFIREGLVAGDLPAPPACVRHNLAQVAALREREARLRRRDLLVDDTVQMRFYDERLPPEVLDFGTFEHFRRRAEQQQPQLLQMTEAVLLARDAQTSEDDFPSQIALSGITFQLKYRFAPGAEDDGVALQVPIGLLPHLCQAHLDYLVPGFFEQRITALLWALPRAQRKPLVPVAETAQRLTRFLAEDARQRALPLKAQLCRQLLEHWQLRVPLNAWDSAELEPQWSMLLELRDEAGKLLACSRDLADLQATYSMFRPSDEMQRVRRTQERADLQDFPAEEVAQQQVLHAAGATAISFPALTVEQQQVALRLFEVASVAAEQHTGAVVVLSFRALGRLGTRMIQSLPDWEFASLRYATMGTRDALLLQVQQCVAERVNEHPLAQIRSPGAFRTLVAQLRLHGAAAASAIVKDIAAVLRERAALTQLLATQKSPAYVAAVRDIEAWLSRRVPPDFVVTAGVSRLPDLLRFIAAARMRLQSLQGRVERDTEHMQALTKLGRQIDQLRLTLPDPRVADTLAWELEELRGQLLAPGFKPRGRISLVRLQRQVETLSPMRER